MFPNSTGITLDESKLSSGTKTFLFDFNIGDFALRDGKLIECDGIDAIKVWIEKILRTEKDRYKIYDNTEYGCHLEDLIIGNSYTAEFIEAELKREIEDALKQNPYDKTRGSKGAYIRYLRYTVDGWYSKKSEEIRKQIDWDKITKER